MATARRCAGLVRLAGAALLLAGPLGCSEHDDTPAPGTERGACHGNGTCNPGLTCLSGICVRPADSRAADMGPADQGLRDGLAHTDRPRSPNMPAATDSKVKPDSGPSAPGKWIAIKPGTFMMGSPASEPCRNISETQHQVTLTRGFEMMATEVTQAQFQQVMGYSPAHFSACGADCPVESVRWYEAAAYANALSAKVGAAACYTCVGSGATVACGVANAYKGAAIYACPGYRLPTEAEWEYAYRAGTTTALYNGDITACKAPDQGMAAIGWYCSNASVSYSGCYDGSSLVCGTPCMGTHAVGQKAPNAWGPYDMAGNVWEWCHDPYGTYASSSVTDPVVSSGSSPVARGGSWINGANYARAANRHSTLYTNQNFSIGFRVVRTLP